MTAPAAEPPSGPIPENEVGSPLRAVAALSVLPFLAVTILALCLALDIDTRRLPMLGLALVTAVIALIPVSIDMGRPPVRRHLLFDMLCIIFVALFTVPVFVHYAWVKGPTDPPGVPSVNLMPADVLRGQITVLIGMAALFVGYLATTLLFPVRDLQRRRAADWPLSALLIVTVGMLGIGWGIVGMSILGLMPAGLGSGFRSTLGSSVIYANVLLVIALVRHRFRPALPILFITVPMVAILGLGTGSKTATLLAPATVALTMMLLGGRIRLRWLIIGILAMTLLYPISNFWRDEITPYRSGVVYLVTHPQQAVGQVFAFVSSTKSEDYVATGFFATLARLDGLGILSVIVRDTPGISPYQNGRTLMLFVYAFVPRVLWPEKPMIPIGAWITAVYGPGPHIQSFTAPTWLGDFYLNFGNAGVFFGMLLYGVILALFQARALGPGASAAAILAAVIVMTQVVLRLEGTFAHTLSSTAFALVPIILIHTLVKYFSAGRPSGMSTQLDTTPADTA
jgi:hypothetical protein